jgi:hypothetical protein
MTSERLFGLFVLLSLAGCHAHADGIQLDLVAHAHAIDVLTDVDENVLHVERFVLTLDTLELLACEDPVARILRELVLPGIAAAHHPSHVPTVFTGPVVIDLALDADQPLGVMAPPPGRYCGVMLVFGAAQLEGTLGEAEVAHALDLGVTLSRTFDELVFSADRLEATLRVHVHAESAFAELNVVDATPELLESSLRTGLESMVSVETMEDIHIHERTHSERIRSAGEK